MIKLFYKEIELGILTFDKEKEEFVYNSNLENEKLAKKKYSALDFYSLSNSINKRSKYLFEDFLVFTGVLTREDIVEIAEIKKTDSVFEKLEKLASIEMFDEEFHIKA